MTTIVIRLVFFFEIKNGENSNETYKKKINWRNKREYGVRV